MGLEWAPTVFQGTLGQPVRRAHADRTEFYPVRFRQGLVEPVRYHGSAHLNALSEADGLIRMEIGVHEIPQGTQVDVRPI
jgi:molybdopterin molybdotransferase